MFFSVYDTKYWHRSHARSIEKGERANLQVALIALIKLQHRGSGLWDIMMRVKRKTASIPVSSSSTACSSK